MGFFDRLNRVVRANLNSLINEAEDPEKILEQTVQEMQDELIHLRQAVAQAIATQKRTERQASQAAATADEWFRRAQLALQKGDESMAREALARRKSYQDTADALKSQVQQQSGIVGQLKQNMMTLESKLSEAKTKKDMYIARARSAKASQQLNDMLNRVGTNKAAAAFDRMEERVHQLEALAEVSAELSSGGEVERKFRALESSGDIDAELESLKAQLAGRSSQASLPSNSKPTSQASLDQELEQLRSKLEEG
ncbi:MAG: PspA/IM30 family protein [Elainellaceae cyanobacterium]